MKEYIKKVALYLCISYTSVSFSSAVMNLLGGKQTDNTNNLVMFGFCLIVSIVLSLYEYFDQVSPLAMILIQYLVSCVLCGLLLLVVSLFDPITPQGWLRLYISFTIPYIVLAGICYYSIYLDTKKKAGLIREIQERTEKSCQ